MAHSLMGFFEEAEPYYRIFKILMIHGMTCLFHQNRNNLLGFIIFRHVTISIIHEPIINTDLPQLVSQVFRKGKKEDWLESCAR